MTRHADAETLAAFREELLSRRKAARVSAHLAGCPRCAGLDARLTEVSALLTRSTAPPMPDALTARIEAAIAAEAAARAATTANDAVAAGDGAVAAADGAVTAGAAGAGSGPRVRAARPSRPAGGPGRSRLALRVAAVTAAVAVVAGGGYGVARLLSGNPGPGTAAGSAATPAFGASAGSGASGKAPGVSSGGRMAPGAGGGSAAAVPVVSSGTNYQPGQLEAQVRSVLTRHSGKSAVGSGPGASPANQPAGSALSTPACVPRVTGGKHPLLVDLATYQGRPATIIVVRGGPPGTLQALVVAGECTATTGHVLHTTTFSGSG